MTTRSHDSAVSAAAETRHQDVTSKKGWVAWVAAIAWLIATAAQAGSASNRWEETGYGVSLQPPPGAVVTEYPGDGVLMHMALGQDMTITLSVQTSKVDVTLEPLVEDALHQLATKHPSAQVIAQDSLNVGDVPGAVLMVGIPTGRKGPWVLGQGYLQIGPRTFALLSMQATQDAQSEAVKVFDRVVRSVRVQDPREVAGRRAKLIEAGHAWATTLTAGRIRDALVPEQWLRVVAQGKDVGYMQITQQTTEMLGRKGVGVRVRSHVEWGAKSVDTLSDFFLSDDFENEIWSIRSTTRGAGGGSAVGAGAGAVGPANTTWVETGLRAYDLVTVNRDTPTGRESHEWRIPDQGYLSQVQLTLADRLLVLSGACPPGSDAIEMGFYTYDPSQAELSFRTVRAEVEADGTTLVTTRPSPDQAAHRTRLMPDGSLVRRERQGGQTLVSTSKEHVMALWRR